MHKDEVITQNKTPKSNDKFPARVARPGYKLIEIPEDSFPIVFTVGKGCTVEFTTQETHDKDGNLIKSQELRKDKDGKSFWFDRLAESKAKLSQ